MKHFTKTIVTTGLVAILMSVGGCGDADGEIAEVNGRPILQSEFDAYLELKRIPKEKDTRAERLLEDYLQREALADLVADSQYIDQRLAQAEVNEFRKQMLISRYFENFLEDRVSAEAVRNYYNTHPEEFRSEQIKVAHILIRTHDKMSDQERQVRLTHAQEIYGKLASGKDFAELAAAESEDKVSAKSGGSLGWVKRGSIDPVFSERVFAMQAGDVSEPFATPFGFHIVKVLEDVQVHEPPFEKVKGDIRYRLRQAAKQAEMERLMAEAEIER